MQSSDSWKPSKFEYRRGRLRASRDTAEVAVHSRLIADRIAEFYESAIPLYVRGKVLDLGCGKVPLYGCYKALASSVTCVDWGNSYHNSRYLDAQVDLTGPLPFESSIFDTVILSDVLEHIPNPEALCGEVSRVLSNGGVLIMNTPFLYWIHESPYDYHRYTEFALRRLMQLSSLCVTSLEPIGGAPDVFVDLLSKNISQIPAFGRHSAAALHWIVDKCAQWPPYRSINSSTRSLFPLAYGCVAIKTKMSHSDAWTF